jgi:hypothetical protein
MFKPNHRLSAVYVTAVLTCLALVNGCASGTVSGSGYNPTTVTNQIDQEGLDAANIKRVVIADVNLDSPSRKYLQKREKDVDVFVAAALESRGWEVFTAMA